MVIHVQKKIYNLDSELWYGFEMVLVLQTHLIEGSTSTSVSILCLITENTKVDSLP